MEKKHSAADHYNCLLYTKFNPYGLPVEMRAKNIAAWNFIP